MRGELKELHDEVLRLTLERKEKLSKLLTFSFGIPEPQARDIDIMKEVFEQLIREENPIIKDYTEDIEVFLMENTDGDTAIAVTTNTAIKNSNYDREKAKAYIDKYWNNYNPAYPAFDKGGGDCANFVSQILHAGGMRFVNDSLQNYKSAEAWYCKPGATNKDSDRRVSFTWKIAASFKNHWINRAARHFMMSCSEVRSDMDEISKSLKIADVVQFCYADGKPWHTLAVTGFGSSFSKNDIILASHTMNSNSRSLYNTVRAFPADYKIRFYIIKG